jgi:hypothetical protein
VRVPKRGPWRGADGPDPADEARHPGHRSGEEAGVGGVVNVRRHHGGVGADFPVFTTLASTALTSSSSLSAAIVCSPHRVVSFISVVGCGSRPSMSMRQNHRHEIESDTSAHNDS